MPSKLNLPNPPAMPPEEWDLRNYLCRLVESLNVQIGILEARINELEKKKG